jgi:hypothetical protein
MSKLFLKECKPLVVVINRKQFTMDYTQLDKLDGEAIPKNLYT